MRYVFAIREIPGIITESSVNSERLINSLLYDIASCHWSSSQQAKKKVDGRSGQNEPQAPRKRPPEVREVKLSECQNSVRLLGPAPNRTLPTPSQSELVGLERHLMR